MISYQRTTYLDESKKFENIMFSERSTSAYVYKVRKKPNK